MKGKPRKQRPARDWHSIGLFSAGIFFGWMLFLAYPYGVTNEETPSYVWAATQFSWLHANPLDWWRTPFLGLLYTAAMRFSSHPTAVIYWLHVGLFSLNAALLLWLFRLVFASRRHATIAAWSFLGIEILWMRTFFFNVQMASDVLYAHLALSAVVLILCGWLSKRFRPMLLGYALIGLIVLLRPAGAALFSVWLPFACIACRSGAAHNAAWLRRCVVVVALAMLPTLAWSARNASLYGQFKPTAYASFNLLERVLPLLRNDDVVLSDPRVNREFIASVRQVEGRIDMEGMKRLPWGRVLLQNSYIQYYEDPPKPGPFGFFAALTQPEALALGAARTDVPIWRTAQRMFLIDKASLPIALGVIRNHPAEYAAIVAQDYMQLFNLSSLPVIKPTELFTNRIQDSYTEITVPAFYPPSGNTDPAAINVAVRNAFAVLTQNPVVRWLRMGFDHMLFVLAHGSALVAAGLLFVARKRKANRFWPHNLGERCVVVLLLFATVATHNALISIYVVPMYRYGIASEAILLLLVFLGPISGLLWGIGRLQKAFGNRGSDVTTRA